MTTRLLTRHIRPNVYSGFRAGSCSHILNHAYTPTQHRTYVVEVRKRIFDRHIKEPMVRLVNPETKSLDPPLPLEELLAATDLSTYRLELVATTPEAIVRRMTKEEARELHQNDKDIARARRKLETQRKQIQMSWGVDVRDMDRKISQARKEIERGNVVNVILAKKKGVPLPPLAVKVAKMDEIAVKVADIANEWSVRSIGTQLAVMFLKPKGKKAPAPSEAVVPGVHVIEESNVSSNN